MAEQDDVINGLIEAFAEPDEPAPEAPPAEEAPDEEPAEEAADDEAAEEEAEEEGEPDDEPEGRKYLSLLGADGKPQRVHIDKLLGDTLHDVQVDGEKKHVTYQELRDGYARQADYTRKTMDLAKERAELAPYAQMVAHAKADPDFVRHVQSYFQRGPDPSAMQAAQLELSDERLADMLGSGDPEAVTRAREILSSRATLRKQHAQRQEVQARAAKEQEQVLRAYLDTERAKVRAAIPDYETKADGMKAYLRDMGYSDQELAQVYDSRMVRVVHDAMLYRHAQESGSKLGLEGKRKAPPPPRAARPGAGKATSASEIQRSKAMTQRAKQSGSTADWAAVIAQRLGL